jgi:putative phosphoribosyl transferase
MQRYRGVKFRQVTLCASLNIMERIFRNRIEAGRLLAQQFLNFSEQHNTLVLALPRGGVPVGYEIAQALKIPLDIFLVRKLGVPGQEELAFGAIAMGNVVVFNESIVHQLGLDQQTIQAVIAKEQIVLDERNKKYRGSRPFPDLSEKNIILVDDGIATGATMRAAIIALRKLKCRQIIIAVPVAPPEIYAQFSSLAEKIICLATPESFFAIGSWYMDFSQTTDEEVYQLLGKKDE